MRRAGLDYIKNVEVKTYKNIDDFFDSNKLLKLFILSQNLEILIIQRLNIILVIVLFLDLKSQDYPKKYIKAK